MSKHLLAAAVVTALAVPVAAHAESVPPLSFYGRAHLSLDHLDNGAEADVDVNSNSSRIGVRASHELDGGLRVFAQIERQLRWDNGSVDQSARDTFLGLQGDFGTLRAGFFDTPLKLVRSQVDLFSDQIGDARNLTRVRDGYSGGDFDFDTRFRNGIHFGTRAFNGWTWDIHYSTNTDSGANQGNDNSATGTALSYAKDRWYAAVAYERKEDTGSNALRMGARYSAGGLRVVGLAQRVTVKGSTLGADQDVTTFGLGASYRLAEETTLKAQHYALRADGSDRDAGLSAVGVDYQVARPLRLMFAFAHTSNDALVRYGMSRGGHGAQQLAAAPGLDTQGFSVALRYDF